MKKFTLLLSLVAYLAINIITILGMYAQCNGQVNESDSIALYNMTLNEPAFWPNISDSGGSIGLIDTLGECRVESFVTNCGPGSVTLSNEEFKLPFLKNLTIYYCSGVLSLDQFNKENFPQLKTLRLELINIEVNSLEFPDFDLPNLEELILIDIRSPDIILPNFSKMPNLKKLVIKNVYKDTFYNSSEFGLYGEIPNFSTLMNLEVLQIERNQIEGSIPNFTNLPILKTLILKNNNLSNPIPNFNNISILEELDLSENQLNGVISNFNNIPLLKKLNFSVNQLTGTIPNFNKLPLLNELVICNNEVWNNPEINDFIGPIPALENCPLLNTNNVDFFCVRPAPENSGCRISESDSLELVNFYQTTNGDNWQVNTGWLIENTSSWWGIELKDTLGKCRVKKILIRGINDTVELPALNLPFLEELTLDYNNFTGNIPDLSSLTNLRILNLGVNNFNGPLPDLNSLTQLEEINLSQNQLEDIIMDYPNQPNLKILDLSGNQLTGQIPSYDNNSELRQLNISNNLLTGTAPDFQNILNLNCLNISDNQLIGSIPDFSNLPNLYTLNVADNQLTNELPNFSNLPVLQSLFVQGNQLAGRIPNFNSLPILEELIVCENNFEGSAPNFSLSPLLNIDAIDFGCLQAARVRGYIYYDTNENCVYDEGDITMPNGLISINNGTNYQPVDENGDYEVAVETGTSVITFIQTSPLWQSTCDDTQTITSLTINDITEIDFANQPNIECTHLTVDIGTPFLRRCFKNTYTVQYCNQGTQTAIDAYIEIDFEPEIIPLNASIPYEENSNSLTFQLGEIGIGECGSFTVVDSVACDAPLSSTGCVEAHIYPDDFCFLSSTWDGANLAANAFCLSNDSVQFIIENLGNNMENPSFYRIYEEDVLSVQGEFELQGGATKILNYPATGATYRLAAEQTPGHPSQDDAQAFFELCGDGNFSTGYINSQLLPDRDSFIDIDCEEIIGSYDPNDKLASPAGVGDRYDIYEGDELTYKIRFQNTGNDTAFTVILVDTLDVAHLDISTIDVLNSSHPYTLAVEDAQILTFTFNDILLVDSTANEQASHGFVTFKIKQNANNQIGDIIKNNAYIYFDYNDAIVTPTVFNTLAEPQFAEDFVFIELPVSIEFENANQFFAKVYPNPVSEVFYIELPIEVINQYSNLQLEIYNIQGQSLQKHPLNKTQQAITVTDLNSGIYYYKLFSNDLTIANGKLLIE